MTCKGCQSDKATRTRSRYVDDKLIEVCDICVRLGRSRTEKKTGFMFGKNHLLAKNSNKALANQVRQEYIGTDHDERRGPDY